MKLKQELEVEKGIEASLTEDIVKMRAQEQTLREDEDKYWTT